MTELPFSIEPKDKPKWFEFRRKIACGLVRLAKCIYPASPEVVGFFSDLMVEATIKGSCIVKMEDAYAAPFSLPTEDNTNGP